MFIRSTNHPTFHKTKQHWFLFQENNLLLTDENTLPELTETQARAVSDKEVHYLGDWDTSPVYTMDVAVDVAAPKGMAFQSFRQFYKFFDDEMFVIASSASQVCRWDREHQFCGKCGGKTVTGTDERGKKCVECENLAYPHIAPAAIMAVVKGDKVLLAQNYKWTETKLFSSLAGFVEPGETAEEAVAREVEEEVGIKVKNVRYVNSQSWPFPGSLMLGFVADWESGEITPDGVEIIEAGWYGKDEMPSFIPNKKTISRWILEEALGPLDRE